MNSALERENRIQANRLAKAEASLRHLKSIYDEMKSQRDRARKALDDARLLIQRFIHSVAAVEVARLKRDGEPIEEWNEDELVHLAIDVVRTRERELRKANKELQEELDVANRRIEELTQQVYELQEQRLASYAETANHLSTASTPIQQARNPENNSPVHNVSFPTIQANEDRNDRTHTEPEPSEKRSGTKRRKGRGQRESASERSSSAKAERSTERKRDEGTTTAKPVALYVENLAELGSNLADEHRTLLKIIGETGIFRNAELKEHPFFQDTFHPNSNYHQQRLQDMVKAGLLEQDTINIGARGHIHDVFRLTDKGTKLFEILFNKVPVPSQLDEMLKVHSTPQHALLILEVKYALERDGFSVSMDLKDTTLKTSDGKTIHFDLVAKKGGDIRRVECERGLQSERDIHAKLDKWFDVDSRFFFVSPNKTSREKVKEKFYTWAAKHGRKKLVEHKLAAHFTTLEELRKGNAWEEVRFQ